MLQGTSSIIVHVNVQMTVQAMAVRAIAFVWRKDACRSIARKAALQALARTSAELILEHFFVLGMLILIAIAFALAV